MSRAPASARSGRVVRSQIAAPFLRFVRQAGGDADALIQRFRLPPEAETAEEIALPLETLRELYDACSTAANEPFLGLRVAERFPRGTYGALEYICRHASTVREVFRRLARYMSLINDAMFHVFEETSDRGVFRYGVEGERLSFGRQANELGIAAFICVGREVTGVRWSPTRVRFAHPAPKTDGPLRALFGCAIDFDAGQNVLELSEDVLQLPLRTADAKLLALLEQAQGLPSEPKEDLLVRVRAALKLSLKDGPPQMAQLARQLHVSPRTLQRRLGERDTSFQRTVEDVRRALAEEYLADRSLGVSEIAFLLGYAELSTFDRAFKRWTGQAPSEFRR